MKVIWFLTAVFAVVSVSLFISDSKRSYSAMVESMQRHATDDAQLTVRNSSGVISSLQDTDPVGGTYATRDTTDLGDIILPADQ